jgi:hypothetical protein
VLAYVAAGPLMEFCLIVQCDLAPHGPPEYSDGDYIRHQRVLGFNHCLFVSQCKTGLRSL